MTWFRREDKNLYVGGLYKLNSSDSPVIVRIKAMSVTQVNYAMLNENLEPSSIFGDEFMDVVSFKHCYNLIRKPGPEMDGLDI